ncbi:phosphonate C-P lyase system protein PhnH [Yoonia vestfoldensis]|jgi:alpha-D-ribose 1-methylphosphonate 5-triphosphate synthase subunit PhnH|uniref:phosphonate C-P lyase system protein PhnH n=1 Tax=Yoonia vestfoldensis TaxID=245188 RepID=UPI0004783C5E|nr:phosphonate C-P lyase system protein PhnH [Yoonia vestfoldensis]
MPSSSLSTPPFPDAEERRDNAAFAAMMWALARPGQVQPLAEPGALALALALCDRETRVWAEDDAFALRIAATGSRIVKPQDAQQAFFTALDNDTALADFDRLPVGSALYPDEGASVFAPARLGEGTRLSLTGPGVDGAVNIRIAGLHPGLWAARARVCRYPAGVELFLICGTGLIGLPRSTMIEVL